jgi:hypothetical protein
MGCSEQVRGKTVLVDNSTIKRQGDLPPCQPVALQNTGNKNILVNDRKANIRPTCKTWENTIETKCRYYGLPAVRRKHVDKAEVNQERRILPELRPCIFRRCRVGESLVQLSGCRSQAMEDLSSVKELSLALGRAATLHLVV